MAAVQREFDRRPWIEQDRHVETVTVIIKLDRNGNEMRCIVRTEGVS